MDLLTQVNRRAASWPHGEANERETPMERPLRLLKTLANAQRLRVLAALAHRERSVAELRRLLPDLSPSALSQHLGVLRAAHVVRTRRATHTVWYALEPHALEPLQRRLHKLCPTSPTVVHATRRPRRDRSALT